ncbi:MAG TPA: hypothetical protein VFC31_03385 [Candidatus Limnocylindria bacterium]|nr:hypothetical protein [Candidatus Limnocylindria bacterium]
MPKTRAEREKDRGTVPTKRSVRGGGPVARRDPEVGVTSRARKRKQGSETMPDPRTGARPGKEHSKWRPELRKRAPKPQTP